MYTRIQSKLSIIFYSFGQKHNYICYTLRKATAKIAQYAQIIERTHCRKTGKKLNAKDAETMKVIDLTHTITEKMPVFPGTEQQLQKKCLFFPVRNSRS